MAHIVSFLMAVVLISGNAYSQLRVISDAEAEMLKDAEGGGWSGNGGDTQSQDNVWFLGEDQEIRYCIESSNDFPLTSTKIESIVNRSIKEWQEFFLRYQINGLMLNDLLRAGVKALPVNLKFVFEKCQSSTDLQFLFGVSNEVIDLYNKLNTEEGIGLALRRSYDHKSHWNPGYIWIANFTKSERRIKHLVLHELGHVLGLKHNSVFVMSDQIAVMLKSERFSDSFFGRIESEAWPYGVLVGERRELTSYRGMKETESLPLPISRCDESGIMASFMPRIIAREFRLRPEDCVSLFLEKSKESENVTEFLLEIRKGGGELVARLPGQFTPTPINKYHPGPGVYSLWESSGDKYYWGYVPFSKAHVQWKKAGCFKSLHRCIPANINLSRGIVLELFDQDGKWWILNAPSIVAERALEEEKYPSPGVEVRK